MLGTTAIAATFRLYDIISSNLVYSDGFPRFHPFQGYIYTSNEFRSVLQFKLIANKNNKKKNKGKLFINSNNKKKSHIPFLFQKKLFSRLFF